MHLRHRCESRSRARRLEGMRTVFCGLTTMDLIQKVEAVPAANEKVVSTSAILDVGGPAANAARTAGALGAFPTLVSPIDLAAEHRVWTHLVSEEDFRDLSADAQGLVVVANMPESADPAEALAGAQLAVATVATADPGNLGTIIRTADAGGAATVLVGSRSAELFSPKVVRSTAGSLFHVPCASGLSLEQIVEYARGAGMQVLAADGAGEWELSALQNNAYQAELLGANIDGPDLRRPTLWVLGNEARGFDDVDLSVVDATVSIPLYGSAESLNVSVAGAVCIYTSAMVQRTAGED